MTQSTPSSEMRRPTARDVATLAGVSTATVSFVINDRRDRVSPDTFARVERAIELLGYRPNPAARQLRTQRSRVIGLVGEEIATGPFGGGIIRGAQDQALAHGHTLFVVDTGGDPAALPQALAVMKERHVDGVIFTSVMTAAVTPPEQLYEGPAVLVNCYAPGSRAPSVLPDEDAGGADAIRLLVSQGHRRIGFINGVAGTYPAESRLRGYHMALTEAGIENDPALVRSGNWNADSGYLFAKEFLTMPTPPTALFCSNDRMAVGAYFAIKELGLSVPEDISVLGYDNQTELAAFAHPPLSSVQLPYYEMGRLGAELLLARADAGTHMVSCSPVVRESITANRAPV